MASGCAFITRASVGPGGVQGNANSLFAAPLSADGRYVVFVSDASNLVAGDTNGTADVFVRDNVAGTTQLVSVASGGTQANDASYVTDISPDGRYVLFHSVANNLVAGDTNGQSDVFLRDRTLGTTERVSVGPGGAQGDKPSGGGFVSADGRYVMFTSSATNLVAGDTNGNPPCPEQDPDCTAKGSDVFVRDRVGGTTERVSVASDGSEANNGSGGAAITPDGRYVLFTSRASNLLPGGTNYLDLFVRDRQLGTTERINVSSNGTAANSFTRAADISADGRFVAFTSAADNLVPNDFNSHEDLFVRDRLLDTIARLSVTSAGAEVALGTGESSPSISADGRFVAFTSRAPDLVPGDTNHADDVFVHDRVLHTTSRVSTGLLGTQGDSAQFYPLSVDPRISADGRYVSFWSQAENLVGGDTNQREDVFVKFVATPTLTQINPATIARGETTTLTVTGSRFTAGVSSVSFGSGVTVNGWNVINDTQLDVNVSVAPHGARGPRTLLVSAPGTGGALLGGGTAVCEGCLTVT